MKIEFELHPCELCHNKYKDGRNIHEGHMLKSYGEIMVCPSCWNSNWDGWAPHKAALLEKIMEEKGLPLPPRNEQGFLPRE